MGLLLSLILIILVVQQTSWKSNNIYIYIYECYARIIIILISFNILNCFDLNVVCICHFY